MVKHPEVQIIDELLNQGKTGEVLERAGALLARGWGITPEDIQEILALIAWAYYRRKEFDKAEEEAKKAGNNERALRCLAAIAAYVKKDGVLMRQYVDQLPDSPARDNTFVIYAREPSDKTSSIEIFNRLFKWVGLHEPRPVLRNTKDKTNVANLLNNTARWLLAKEEKNPRALELAYVFMGCAIHFFYGRGSNNLHHRAGAWYWQSVIEEKLGRKEEALYDCKKSVELWRRQIKIDLANPNFQKSLEGAKARLKELKGKTNAKKNERQGA